MRTKITGQALDRQFRQLFLRPEGRLHKNIGKRRRWHKSQRYGERAPSPCGLRKKWDWLCAGFAAFFAQKKLSIGLDTYIPREQADCIVSPYRRDPYPVNRTKFLYRPIFKLRAKRGVPPRQLFSIRHERSLLSHPVDGAHATTAVPARTAQVRLASCEKEF